jgi:F5/8 type C domain
MNSSYPFTALGATLLLMTFFVCSPSILEAHQVKAQYVRIELPGTERTLSLAEIKVYSGQENIAVTGTATQASTFSDARASRAIDGNSGGEFSGRSVTSTATQATPWWELDLGSEHTITTIIVFNRTDCCRDRISPARILVLDKQKEVVWEDVIKTTEAQYEFRLTLFAPDGRRGSQNLLRNSSFLQLTNPSLPDYWDLHHVAALTMQNLHNQYGIDENMHSPVLETKVLRVHNSEVGFSHLNLMPRRFFSDLPDGQYTFSVYLKSSNNGMEYKVSRAWGQGQPATHKLTTNWARYSTTFRISHTNSATLQPVMFFPSNGTYYITAPQLERGNTPTEFQPSVEDEMDESTSISSREQLKNLLTTVSGALARSQRSISSAYFEYDYYTSQRMARLILNTEQDSHRKLQIRCTDGRSRNLSIPIHDDSVVGGDAETIVDIPISDLAPGEYTCSVSPQQEITNHIIASAKLVKRPASNTEVRINHLRRFISINEKPFHIIGMGVGSWRLPPDWYFRDLATHGVNTVFYTRPPDKSGDYNLNDADIFLSGAARHGLKAIIGIPLAGAKPANWRQRLTSFSRLISRFKDSPTVIGWYPVDEPAAHTWRDDELMEVHDAIKELDPYRLIFVNWAYDGIPAVIGQEPRGTLQSTDIYSSDYYPFAGQGHSMEGFTSTSIRALSTSRIRKKLAHSWIQLYGGLDAWREPTGDELNYMVHLNLIYGGHTSYWDTKSNSKATWARLTTINREVKLLSEELFINPDARELVHPTTKANFSFSVWKKGQHTYLIVAHNGNETETFTYDATPFGTNGTLHAKNLFAMEDVLLVNGRIQDVFSPFECKAYVLDGE